MALGRKISNNKFVRDVDADYKEALLAEYHVYVGAGAEDRAQRVAEELKKMGYEVEKPKRAVKQRAVAADDTEKAVDE